MTDSLIYLTTGWPNITYKSLCKISRGSTIILVGNKFGIWYSCDTTTKQVGYHNVDCVKSYNDKKSNSSWCFKMGNLLISWHNKKHSHMYLFTIEAEYTVVGL